MSKRYIDLASQIFGETNTVYLADIKETLRWLDENPADLPGRTITEGELTVFIEDTRACGSVIALSNIGITVVPDPKPTNAEKLTEEVKRALPEGEGTIAWEEFARRLDAAGVKAPEAGGDDDQ